MKCAPRNKINLVPFNVESFLTDTIPNYLEVEADSWDPSTQFKYLRDHLSAIDTKCLVFEEMYKDRHFISEHTLYYSTCHNVYPNFCHRVHAFGVEINIEEFETALCGQGQDEENNTSRLCKNYLGFIVIRPVPAAHIGRTVLKPYDDNPDRKFTATRMYRVHLVGLDLKVDGLAFQQQDRRVGACATYAIWSALQKASYESGLRTPTPGEISESATRYHIFSRPYPAPGLDEDQICEAIRSQKLDPHKIEVTDPYMTPPLSLHRVEETKLHLTAYLGSGFPIILIMIPISGEGSTVSLEFQHGHAVTVTGYRLNSSISDEYTVIDPENEQNILKSHSKNLQVDKIYINDDRIGPYTRAIINNGYPGLVDRMCIEIPSDAGEESEFWLITDMIVPLYPKIRTSAEELFSVSSDWIDVLSDLLNIRRERFYFKFYFSKSDDLYKNIRSNTNVANQEKSEFLRTISLSRYVGIFEIELDEHPFLYLFWDTTDRLRNDSQDMSSMLGVLCENSTYLEPLRVIFSSFGILIN